MKSIIREVNEGNWKNFALSIGGKIGIAAWSVLLIIITIILQNYILNYKMIVLFEEDQADSKYLQDYQLVENAPKINRLAKVVGTYERGKTLIDLLLHQKDHKTLILYNLLELLFLLKQKTVKSKNRTPLEIAVDYDVNYTLLLKYNDINAEDFFKADQNVFLQPKRFNGSKKKYMVKPGDSMWEISQMFGIKLNHLYKKNLMNIGEQPKPGETIYLKRKWYRSRCFECFNL